MCLAPPFRPANGIQLARIHPGHGLPVPPQPPPQITDRQINPALLRHHRRRNRCPGAIAARAVRMAKTQRAGIVIAVGGLGPDHRRRHLHGQRPGGGIKLHLLGGRTGGQQAKGQKGKGAMQGNPVRQRCFVAADPKPSLLPATMPRPPRPVTVSQLWPLCGTVIGDGAGQLGQGVTVRAIMTILAVLAIVAAVWQLEAGRTGLTISPFRRSRRPARHDLSAARRRSGAGGGCGPWLCRIAAVDGTLRP